MNPFFQIQPSLAKMLLQAHDWKKEFILERYTIGITHVFSCINICGVQRKVFEHKADRPSAQTSPEGPGKC